MNAMLYGIRVQLKMDIRSKTLLVTCYVVPLLFFAIMGGIFTSLMPEAKNTLIQSMTIMGVSMGAFIGVPPSMVEVYGTDIKKMYIANGIPLCFGVITLVVSAFIHLMIMTMIIFTLAPIVFHATIPSNIPLYFITLALFVIVSLAISCVLGLAVKNQAKLTMYSQVVFLPSIMLSGIMFSAELLPNFLESIGKLFPATWGYTLLIQKNINISTFLPLLLILAISVFASMQLLKKFVLNDTKKEVEL